jgi:Zn-dependent protease with chaperone function
VDFFARQEQTRRTSRLLVAAFLVSFIVCALATTIAGAVALRLYMENNSLFLGTATWQDWLDAHLTLVAAVAGGTLAVMILASLYRAASLSSGGGQVARMLGATAVTGEGSDPLQRRLINVVEEIALASGVPVPEIYVLEQEAGINAFAAGLNHANAAITVTRGALERLERAELQGVIAHEFSHILNGDMRLNQQLIGLSFGILVLSLAGRWLLRSARFARRGRNSGGVAAALAIGVALTVIGAIGLLCTRAIKAAVSRQRESLADASAVQFTREPQGLAGALKKIAGYGARITTVETEEVAHMLFERGTRSFSGWFATHPPLLERIKALEPTFDPRDLPAPGDPLSTPPPDAAGNVAAFAGTASGAAAPPSTADPIERAGRIEAPEVGGALRSALPDEVYHAARSRDASLLLVLALALATNEQARQRQLALVESQLGAARSTQCRRLSEELRNVDLRLRLPLLELTLPALKQRPAEQIRYLLDLLGKVGALDTEARLFDYVLLRLLEAYLLAQPGAARDTAPAERSKAALRAAVHALLANVAAYGSADAAAARAAYAAGLAALGAPAAADSPSFDPPEAARDLAKLDAALRSLATLRPNDKQRILRGVHAAIRSDRKIEVDEAELFRAIAATLDCPVPPGLPT